MAEQFSDKPIQQGIMHGPYRPEDIPPEGSVRIPLLPEVITAEGNLQAIERASKDGHLTGSSEETDTLKREVVMRLVDDVDRIYGDDRPEVSKSKPWWKGKRR